MRKKQLFSLLYTDGAISLRMSQTEANTFRTSFYAYKNELDNNMRLIYDDPSEFKPRSVQMRYDKEKGIAHFKLVDGLPNRGKSFELVTSDGEVQSDLDNAQDETHSEDPMSDCTQEENTEGSN